MHKHILIVDDQEAIRSSLSELLYDFCKKNGVETHTASNPKSAFEKIQKLMKKHKSVIMLITDLCFEAGKDDGLDLIQIVYKKYGGQRPFIVILTAFLDAEDGRFKKLRHVVDEILIKPKGILSVKSIADNFFNCPEMDRLEKILP